MDRSFTFPEKKHAFCDEDETQDIFLSSKKNMLQGKSGNETGALGNISKVIAMSFLPFFRL